MQQIFGKKAAAHFPSSFNSSCARGSSLLQPTEKIDDATNSQISVIIMIDKKRLEHTARKDYGFFHHSCWMPRSDDEPFYFQG